MDVIEPEGLKIVVGEGEGNRIVFALDRLDGAFVMGPIAVRDGREWLRLEGRNGIETMALAYLRDDLRDLLLRGGAFHSGDHDYEDMVNLEARDGRFTASVDLPSHDRWEIPIQQVTRDGLQRIVEVIDEVEGRFGALDQHCGCGLPRRHWRPLE